MTRKRWIVCGGLALGAALALGFLLHWTLERRRAREQALVTAVFSGDAAAFDALRGLKLHAVVLLEEFLRREQGLDATQARQAITDLTSTNEPARRLAQTRLTLLPACADEWLRARYEQSTNADARERMKPLLNRAKAQQRIAGFLSGLYSQHGTALFMPRRTALERDPRDLPAQLFFAYTPFDQAWTMLKNSPADTQLRFLLLRVFAERDEHALEYLERFSAGDVLRVAAQTWWPVEIEPPAKDGAYLWTTRAASTNGNTATRLLRLSLRPASKPGEPDEWLHLDRWLRWTYLFRYDQPILGKEAVVFAENSVRKASQSWRTNPGAYREKAEPKFWLPQSHSFDAVGLGRCETVRGVPPSARMPVVALSKAEEIQWHLGSVYEWARPLFPPEFQARVRFSSNRFPVPKIIRPSDAAAHETARPRTLPRG